MSMIPDNVQSADWSVFEFKQLNHPICELCCVTQVLGTRKVNVGQKPGLYMLEGVLPLVSTRGFRGEMAAGLHVY